MKIRKNINKLSFLKLVKKRMEKIKYQIFNPSSYKLDDIRNDKRKDKSKTIKFLFDNSNAR